MATCESLHSPCRREWTFPLNSIAQPDEAAGIARNRFRRGQRGARRLAGLDARTTRAGDLRGSPFSIYCCSRGDTGSSGCSGSSPSGDHCCGCCGTGCCGGGGACCRSSSLHPAAKRPTASIARKLTGIAVYCLHILTSKVSPLVSCGEDVSQWRILLRRLSVSDPGPLRHGLLDGMCP